jgi:[ribosomal protein S5]-alanine N-acetyltransferase
VADVAPIASDRLDLIPLPLEFHRYALAGDAAAAGRVIGLPVTPELLGAVPSRFRFEQLLRDPRELPYLVRAMVLRDAEPRIVGAIGFHEPPDARGRAEVGYGVLAADRRRGFAREALLALTDWGLAEGGVATCVASVSPHNTPSLSLIASLGFEKVGEQWDDEDGLEHVFERPLPLPRP